MPGQRDTEEITGRSSLPGVLAPVHESIGLQQRRGEVLIGFPGRATERTRWRMPDRAIWSRGSDQYEGLSGSTCATH